MSTTINFSVEVPSARGEDWRVYSSDEKEDSVHDTEQLPDRSLSTTDPKSESTDNTPSQKATHPNQARPDPNGLTSTHAQDDVPHRKRKVEVGQTETLVDRKSHHSVRSRSSLTIQLAKAAKSDSNARWKVKKRLELSKAWPSLTDAEQEERKEAAIEELMQRRFIKRQSRENFESILEDEASYDGKPTYPQAQPEVQDGTTLKDNPNHAVAKFAESSASQNGHELTIPEPLEAESRSHATKPRIGYIARSEFDNYIFLAACVRHAPNDVKLDFDAIAQELQIPQETVITRLRELKTRLQEQGS
ncbi:hypothetical protein LTR10_016264 [Elasticomyces elasticus]|uniref:Uncharacterized protein n=1 Tax=Exophiala sideris TaxID=1016849 RepID=A0ABR0JN33_9EURO|nr:hypothetical protein LTR10_016264 [Elasticomyces elasticus]KAK5037903.1 hypothetical protein LTS07_001370 [Exophiala sideris]KAK5043886.1 hypothetical protein LTR13_000240 [Exophiala sideris]KAK5067385.1 hypothetical protein LTR69_001372 [Exophiala sideris]KAK5182718.1 hypothetical protein LTR44_005109 [Eurotiomycetes sp. CCFEE 6388]